jgi:hypothetical protein
MSLQSSLYAFLISDVGVSALVGTRVYPLVIPEQVYDEATKRPCLVYSMRGLDQTQTFCETIELQRADIGIDCYAKTYEASIALATAVKTALTDYVGTMGDVEISKLNLNNQFDLLDLEPGLFRVALSFFVWHAA